MASDFKEEYFTKTDISNTQTISIDFGIKKVKIISPHNPDSYNLIEKDKNQTVLEIIEPDEFWKINYLVILTKG